MATPEEIKLKFRNGLIPTEQDFADLIDIVSDTAAIVLPSQEGASGQFLTTDGVSASWGAVDLASKEDIGVAAYLDSAHVTAGNPHYQYYLISDATSSLNLKVDKIDGKGLSTNDYTTPEQEKLAALYQYTDAMAVTAVPLTATINGYDVSGNPILNSADVSAVSTSFTINSIPLTGSGLIHNHQAGIEGEPVITDGVSGIFEDNRGKVQIGIVSENSHVWFFTDETREFLVQKFIPMSTWLDITPDIDNYICADSVTESWVVLPSIALVDYIRYIPYFISFRPTGSTHLHKQHMELHAHGDSELANQRIFATDRYSRESGALGVLTVADSTLEIELSGGYVWSANHRNLISEVTSATRDFLCTYFENSWYNYSYSNPVLDTEHYNGSMTVSAGHVLRVNHLYKITTTPTTDFTSYGATGNTIGTIFYATDTTTLIGTDELVTANVPVTIGKYSIAYIWRGIEEEDHLYTAYSESEFDSLELAQASKNISIIPPLASSHAMFIGRIIYKADTVLASEILCESAFDTVFQASSNITVHNSLSGRDASNAHSQYELVGVAQTLVNGINTTSISAVPNTRLINNYPLTENISLSASDIIGLQTTLDNYLPVNNPTASGTLKAPTISAGTYQGILDKVNTWTAGQVGEVTQLTVSASAIAIDLSLSNNFVVTLQQGGSQVLSLPATGGTKVGQSGAIVMFQNPVSASIVTYNTFWKFNVADDPNVTKTASGKNILFYYVYATDAAYCSLVEVV